MSDAAESSIWWELGEEEEGDGVEEEEQGEEEEGEEEEETSLQNKTWKCDRGKDVGGGNKPRPQLAANKRRGRHGIVLRMCRRLATSEGGGEPGKWEKLPRK